MIRLLKFLITGSWHEHSWVIYDENETKIYGDENTEQLPIQIKKTYVQKCIGCGKLKVFKVKR